MRTAFHHDGKYGFVDYDEDNKEILVTHPDKEVRLTVKDYLTNPHMFIVPSGETGVVGDRVLVKAKPTESSRHLNMALSEMYFNTGVHVDWSHKDNRPSNDEKQYFSNANKPIIKSIDGDEEYELI